MIADKGYDAQWLREYIAELGMTAAIPGRSNRKVVVYDAGSYGERHLVERFYWQGEALSSGVHPV